VGRIAGTFLVLIPLCIGFGLANGHFLSLTNASILLQQASINMVLAVGMTFVMLTAGIDLSVGSILAASAMGALLVSLVPHLGMLGIVAGLGIGLLFGCVNGVLIARLRLSPILVTLGSLAAVRGVARLLGNDTTIVNPDLPFAVIGNATAFGLSWLVIIALVVVLLSWIILRWTALGSRIYDLDRDRPGWKQLRCDAGRESRSKLLCRDRFTLWVGSRCDSTQSDRGLGGKAAAPGRASILIFVYTTSGFLAGLGGVMSAARDYGANGSQIGQGYELDAIAAVILGGVSVTGGIGSIWGTLVGVLTVAVLSNGLVLAGVSDVWRLIVKGLVIIGAVALDRSRLDHRE
jgi:ribose transport system permease protein